MKASPLPQRSMFSATRTFKVAWLKSLPPPSLLSDFLQSSGDHRDKAAVCLTRERGARWVLKWGKGETPQWKTGEGP